MATDKGLEDVPEGKSASLRSWARSEVCEKLLFAFSALETSGVAPGSPAELAPHAHRSLTTSAYRADRVQL